MIMDIIWTFDHHYLFGQQGLRRGKIHLSVINCEENLLLFLKIKADKLQRL